MKEEVELSNLISNCFFFFGGLLFIADGLTKNNKIWQFFNFATLKFKAKKKTNSKNDDLHPHSISIIRTADIKQQKLC